MGHAFGVRVQRVQKVQRVQRVVVAPDGANKNKKGARLRRGLYRRVVFALLKGATAASRLRVVVSPCRAMEFISRFAVKPSKLRLRRGFEGFRYRSEI